MKVLDIARGAYVRSPKFLRDLASPALSVLPNSIKYGATYRRWRKDIERSRHDRAFVAARRDEALRALFARAHSQSPFYRERLTTVFGAAPDWSKATHADLKAVPILDKEAVRAAGDGALAVPRSKVDSASTSGSAGQPLVFYLDSDRSVREFAFVNDAWSRCGYREGEARCVVRGLLLEDIDARPWEWEAGLRELRISPFAMTNSRMDLYLDLIDGHGIRYLHGYPSAIEILCRHICTTGWTPRQSIKAVFPISEPLYAHQRETFRAALGQIDIVPFYGLSERVLFAGEVPGEEGTYEFEPLYGHAELVDGEGRAVRKKVATGRVVGTGFISTGMPFIRYETGDMAELVRAAAPENNWRMRVRAITPRRKPEFLVGVEGNRIITPTMVPVGADKFYGVSEFQFYQDRPGECLIKVVPAAGCGEDNVKLFADEIQSRVGSAVRFTCALVDALGGNARGKRLFIDQRLDLDDLAAERPREPA